MNPSNCSVEPINQNAAQGSILSFVRLLFPVDAKERRIAMFGAYFDDSATPGTNPTMLTMACYVASADQWELFEPQWKEFLGREGLSYLRMADLNFRDNGRRIGAYKDWDDVREKRVLQRAHVIVHEMQAVGTAMSVDLPAYQRIVPSSINALLGGPYGFCVFQCLLKIRDDAEQRDWKEPIACFFESKSGYGHEITTLQNQIRSNQVLAKYFLSLRPKKWTFTDKIEDPQLQAADMLAYESNHFWHNMFFGDNRATKKSFQNLILGDSHNHWGNFFREAKLNDFVEHFLA